MLLPFTIILILWKWPLPKYKWQRPFLFRHPCLLIGDKTGNRRVPGIDKQGWCGQPGDNIPPGWSQSISTFKFCLYYQNSTLVMDHSMYLIQRLCVFFNTLLCFFTEQKTITLLPRILRGDSTFALIYPALCYIECQWGDACSSHSKQIWWYRSSVQHRRDSSVVPMYTTRATGEGFLYICLYVIVWPMLGLIRKK